MCENVVHCSAKTGGWVEYIPRVSLLQFASRTTTYQLGVPCLTSLLLFPYLQNVNNRICLTVLL